MGKRKKILKPIKLSIIFQIYENISIPPATPLKSRCGVWPLSGLIKTIDLDFYWSFPYICVFSPIKLSHLPEHIYTHHAVFCKKGAFPLLTQPDNYFRLHWMLPFNLNPCIHRTYCRWALKYNYDSIFYLYPSAFNLSHCLETSCISPSRWHHISFCFFNAFFTFSFFKKSSIFVSSLENNIHTLKSMDPPKLFLITQNWK